MRSNSELRDHNEATVDFAVAQLTTVDACVQQVQHGLVPLAQKKAERKAWCVHPSYLHMLVIIW